MVETDVFDVKVHLIADVVKKRRKTKEVAEILCV
jgi:hypothetical protein